MTVVLRGEPRGTRTRCFHSRHEESHAGSVTYLHSSQPVWILILAVGTASEASLKGARKDSVDTQLRKWRRLRTVTPQACMLYPRCCKAEASADGSLFLGVP